MPDVLGYRSADTDNARGLVIDLERRVLDLESLFEHVLELTANGMTVVSRMDEHVRRERRKA